MRRRQFIALLLGGATAARPLPVLAQQTDQIRRIGVLMNRVTDDPQGHAQLAAFLEGLQQLGWRDSRNVRVDVRWGANAADLERKYAAELVALAPDVILSAGTQGVAALQQVTSSLPIVFVGVSDPVGAGFVDSLSRPGHNTTGFMLFEYSLSAKWLELLKQITPSITQVAVLRDAGNPAGIAQFGAIRSSASSLGVDISPINARDPAEIERAVAAFAHSANRGLIVTPSASELANLGDLVIKLAARYKLPAVYAFPVWVAKGGLISYGPDLVDQFRRGAAYVDRILKGEKPADLPVQAPTKFELAINLKAAKALGLTMPASLLASADEVIE
jgi:putative tryptophan/tyrosine transport system substrate-binding protein